MLACSGVDVRSRARARTLCSSLLVKSASGGLTETLADSSDEALSLLLVTHLFLVHCEAVEDTGREALDDRAPHERE